MIIGASVLLAGLATCAPAGAAKLFIQTNQWDLARYATYNAGAEANNVTLGGQDGRVYVFRDPNVPITTPAIQPPSVDTNPNHLLDGILSLLLGAVVPVSSSYNCTSPTGRGQGICVATPGKFCNDGGCYTDTGAHFRAAILGLGAGNDTANVLPGTSKSESATQLPRPVIIFADAGNDTLDTRNNARDYVQCGDGTDSVAADGSDIVFPDCEVVTRSSRLG
jgi:hypothetical protein